MISVIVFGLIASVCAAPQYDSSFRQRFGPPPFFPDYRYRHLPSNQRQELPSNNEYFDTNKLWSEFSKELSELDTMLAEMSKHFATSLSQEGIDGNEYRITIPLSGFEEKDIIVKAREGLLMTQAHHKYSEGSERNYLDIRHLPSSVNVTGTWTFEKGTLKIVFPLKEGVETASVEPVKVITTDYTTKRPNFDREEIEENHSDDTVRQDADVGLSRGDQDREVMTNEIQDNAVEATTYAVDLKNEVEFVPIRY